MASFSGRTPLQYVRIHSVNVLLLHSFYRVPVRAMPKTLTLELPDDAFSALRSSPEEFGRELRLAAAIKWYEMERISQGKAAEIAGLSRSAFIEALARYGVSPIQVSPSRIEEEVQQALGDAGVSEAEDGADE